MSGHRAWIEVRRTLPDDSGDYARYLAASLGPRFARAYLRGRARRCNPRPLCIDGQEYHRRSRARRGRKR